MPSPYKQTFHCFSEMNLFDRFLSRNKDFIGAVAAVSFGIGAGCVGVAIADVYMDRNDRLRTFWDAGTTALVAGCLATSAAARGSMVERRRWR
jgi:hypothetical protein